MSNHRVIEWETVGIIAAGLTVMALGVGFCLFVLAALGGGR